MPARRAAMSHRAMSIPAIAWEKGPGSPDWIATMRVFDDRCSNTAAGWGHSRPTISGARTETINRARCSAAGAGKLHHASPYPTDPSEDRTLTTTAGRSSIVPKAVPYGPRRGSAVDLHRHRVHMVNGSVSGQPERASPAGASSLSAIRSSMVIDGLNDEASWMPEDLPTASRPMTTSRG